MAFRSTRRESPCESPYFRVRYLFTQRLWCAFFWIPIVKLFMAYASALAYLIGLTLAPNGPTYNWDGAWNILYDWARGDSRLIWGQVAFMTLYTIRCLLSGRRLMNEETFVCNSLKICKDKYLNSSFCSSIFLTFFILTADQATTTAALSIVIPPTVVDIYGAVFMCSTVCNIEKLFPDRDQLADDTEDTDDAIDHETICSDCDTN